MISCFLKHCSLNHCLTEAAATTSRLQAQIFEVLDFSLIPRETEESQTVAVENLTSSAGIVCFTSLEAAYCTGARNLLLGVC